VKKPTIVALILLALVFTVLAVWFANRTKPVSDAPMSPSRPVVAADAPKNVDPLSAVPGSASTREGVEAAKVDAPKNDVAPPPAPSEMAVALHVHGRVLDLSGAPVAGLDVRVRDGDGSVLARSGADGSFDFETKQPWFILVAESPAFTTMRALPFRSEAVREGFIIVAPTVSVSGSVVDESGLGIEGASIAVIAGEGVLSSFPLPLDTTSPMSLPETKSGPGGAFTLAHSVALAKVTLRASHEGFADAELPAPMQPESNLRFVLKPAAAVARFVTGVVVHADGTPTARARVHFGEVDAGVDERGSFRFAVPEWVPDTQFLVAIEVGAQAAAIADYGKVLNASKDEPVPVRLVLGPAPLSISGHVVDGNHAPLAGWTVGLLHATPISSGRAPPITAEGLTAGTETAAPTGAEGAFKIEGLLDRKYELYAYDGESLGRVETAAVQAGVSDFEIVVPADMYAENVTGRVVGHDGAPITGVSVSLGQVIFTDYVSSSWINGMPTMTDGQGAFTLPKVPRRFAHLQVDGEIVLPKSFPLEGVDLSKPLRLEVDRRCHFRVEGLPSSAPAVTANDATGVKTMGGESMLGAYDASGKELTLMSFQSGGWSQMSRQYVSSDSTRVFAVSEQAVELRLYDTYEHVAAKRAVRLVPGEVTVVKW
jgi:hypothetical protein